MFKIGEFSKLMQISVRMLRYYDELGLLKPEVIDAWTGYRMYSVRQIPVLNKILYLRDSGFNIAEIALALEHKEDTLLLEQLDTKYAEIEQDIQAAREKLKKIDLAKRELLHGKTDMHYHISVKSVPECQVLSLRRVIPDYYAEGVLWKELSSFALENRIQISDNAFTIYHDLEYKETNVDVELCAPVKVAGKSTADFIYRTTEPVPLMACTMVYGDFSNIAAGYQAFAGWLLQNTSYIMSGKTRQIVHRGPWNECNPEKYLTQLQIPLRTG